MKEENKPLPMDQIGNGERGQLSLGGVRLPETKSNTRGDHLQDISFYLLPGERNARPLSYLVEVTGLDARSVRLKIQRERLAGAAILSNCQTGYFLAASEEERSRCVKSMLRRAAEIQKSAAAIAASEVFADGC